MKSGNISNVTHSAHPHHIPSLSVFVSERGTSQRRTREQTRMHQGADTVASGSRDERLWEQTRLNLGRCSPTDLGGGLTKLFYNTIMLKENRPKGNVSKLNRAF